MCFRSPKYRIPARVNQSDRPMLASASNLGVRWRQLCFVSYATSARFCRLDFESIIIRNDNEKFVFHSHC